MILYKINTLSQSELFRNKKSIYAGLEMALSNHPALDWWDDFDFPASLQNQYFADLLDEYEIRKLAAKTKLPPNAKVSINNGSSEISYTETCFQISHSTGPFKLNEIKVSVDEYFIVVKAKHADRKDENETGHTISRELVRKYPIPKNCRSKELDAYFFRDKVVISVPLHVTPSSYDVKIRNIDVTGETMFTTDLSPSNESLRKTLHQMLIQADKIVGAEDAQKESVPYEASRLMAEILSNIPEENTASSVRVELLTSESENTDNKGAPVSSEKEPVQTEPVVLEEDSENIEVDKVEKIYQSQNSAAKASAGEFEENLDSSSERKTVQCENDHSIRNDQITLTIKALDNTEVSNNEDLNIESEEKVLLETDAEYEVPADQASEEPVADKNSNLTPVEELKQSKENCDLKVAEETEKEPSEENASSKANEETNKQSKGEVTLKAEVEIENDPSEENTSLKVAEETEKEPTEENASLKTVEKDKEPSKESGFLKAVDEKLDSNENTVVKTESMEIPELSSSDSDNGDSPVTSLHTKTNGATNVIANGDAEVVKKIEAVDESKTSEKPTNKKTEDKVPEIKSKTVAAEKKESKTEVEVKPNTRGRKSVAPKTVKGRK